MAVKYPNSKVFKGELKSKKLEKIYLFIGEEEGDKDKVINLILDKVFSSNDEKKESVNRFNIMGKSDKEKYDEFVKAVDYAISESMFSGDKFCIIKNIDSIKAVKSNKSIITDMIETLPDSTRLIMTATGNSVPAVIPKDLHSKIKIVQFWKMFESDIHSYVASSINKMGFQIEQNALSHFVDLTGRDIRKVDDGLEMIKNSKFDSAITVELIDELIYDLKEVTVFDYIEFLFKRDKKALDLLKKLLDDFTPELQILSLIVRQVEMLEKFHLAVSQGENRDGAIRKAGVFGKSKDSFLLHSGKFTPRMLRGVFSIIAKADYELKSGVKSKDFMSNPLTTLTSDILFGRA